MNTRQLDQLLADIEGQLTQGVDDPVGLLERSAEMLRTLRLEVLTLQAPCSSCGNIVGSGSGVGPMGMK